MLQLGVALIAKALMSFAGFPPLVSSLCGLLVFAKMLMWPGDWRLCRNSLVS
jgi:hypothetical protein